MLCLHCNIVKNYNNVTSLWQKNYKMLYGHYCVETYIEKLQWADIVIEPQLQYCNRKIKTLLQSLIILWQKYYNELICIALKSYIVIDMHRTYE